MTEKGVHRPRPARINTPSWLILITVALPDAERMQLGLQRMARGTGGFSNRYGTFAAG